MAGCRLLECSSFVRAEDTRLLVGGTRRCHLVGLTTGFSGETVHFRHSHWPSGMYGTP
jgi:hypothetical protein